MTTAPTISYETLMELTDEIVKYGLDMMKWCSENPDEVTFNINDIECTDQEQLVVEEILKKLGIEVE